MGRFIPRTIDSSTEYVCCRIDRRIFGLIWAFAVPRRHHRSRCFCEFLHQTCHWFWCAYRNPLFTIDWWKHFASDYLERRPLRWRMKYYSFERCSTVTRWSSVLLASVMFFVFSPSVGNLPFAVKLLNCDTNILENNQVCICGRNGFQPRLQLAEWNLLLRSLMFAVFSSCN